jgi:hypothetical protein
MNNQIDGKYEKLIALHLRLKFKKTLKVRQL